MHQGYEICFMHPDEGDDPAVYFFSEGWDAPKRQWDSFVDFIQYFLHLHSRWSDSSII
jgi:hypothetical protein